MHAPIDRIAQALDEAQLLVERRGALPAAVSGITDDSRAVRPGSLFVAVKGSERDGHDYLEGAASAGASAAIVQDPSRTSLPAEFSTRSEARRRSSICRSVTPSTTIRL